MTWVNEEGLAMTWNEREKDDATDVIALKIASLPFALSLSKGERPVHGSTSSPRTGSSFVIEIIFSCFVVLIAISMTDSRVGGNLGATLICPSDVLRGGGCGDGLPSALRESHSLSPGGILYLRRPGPEPVCSLRVPGAP